MSELFTRILAMIESLLISPLIWVCPIKWTIVIPGSSAIRFTFGHPSKDLKPGIHFGTTGQTLHKGHTNTKLAIAESMYVLTEDGLSLRIRGVAIYKIVSLVNYLTMTEDSDSFMIEACEAAIRHAVSLVPFDDLVVDSDTVETTIAEKISEICEDLGIQVQRYRFQDVELTDPIGRGLSSVKSMGPKLTESAERMANRLSISNKEALMVLSPNIQFMADIESPGKPKPDFYEEEEENES